MWMTFYDMYVKCRYIFLTELRIRSACPTSHKIGVICVLGCETLKCFAFRFTRFQASFRHKYFMGIRQKYSSSLWAVLVSAWDCFPRNYTMIMSCYTWLHGIVNVIFAEVTVLCCDKEDLSHEMWSCEKCLGIEV